MIANGLAFCDDCGGHISQDEEKRNGGKCNECKQGVKGGCRLRPIRRA